MIIIPDDYGTCNFSFENNSHVHLTMHQGFYTCMKQRSTERASFFLVLCVPYNCEEYLRVFEETSDISFVQL